jgi:lipid II:glycine glycyltransferase (peptidoglycan interpeptide bridge formation enzyme)
MKATPIDVDWNPELSIFACEPFLKSVGNEFGWLGGMDHSGKLRCILPYTIVHKAILRMVRFRVETIAMDDDFSIEEEKSFLNSAMDFFRSNGADMIIPATTNTIFRTYPDGADVAPYGTYVVDLDLSEETLLSNLSASHRRKVRQAMKSGVEIKGGQEYIETAYTLVRDTFKRSSISFMNFSSFSRMADSLDENIKILVAEYQGVVQGCIVVPYSNYSAYYVYGGSIPKPATGSMILLHWEAIRQFRSLGVKRYDFVGARIDPEEGSKQEGLKAFKERFGGDLNQGYMWKYPLSPLKYKLYCMAARLRSGGDIVDAERHKLKVNK